jgi:hypothetical protein
VIYNGAVIAFGALIKLIAGSVIFNILQRCRQQSQYGGCHHYRCDPASDPQPSTPSEEAEPGSPRHHRERVFCSLAGLLPLGFLGFKDGHHISN